MEDGFDGRVPLTLKEADVGWSDVLLVLAVELQSAERPLGQGFAGTEEHKANRKKQK